MTLNFGAPAAAATAPAQPASAVSPFSFGGAPPAKAPTPLNFGAPAAAPAPAFGGFGAASTSVAQPVAPAPAFGGFGTPAVATPAAPAAFGGFGAAAATSTAAPPAFGGFGAAATATAAPVLGGFGAAATATAPAFGGFGAAVASAAPSLGVATTSAPSLGLGGSSSLPGPGLGGAVPGGGQQGGGQGAAQEQGKVGKESFVPQELGGTVEELRAFVKEEKDVSSEVSHLSDKQFQRIREDTEALSQLVAVLAAGVQQNKARLGRLKMDSGRELGNAEIAVRTRDTPASMQYENSAPTDYFLRLIGQFEAQMASYRKQIDQTEQHLQVMGSGTAVTSEDIVAAVQKLHAAFTDLAARYQGLHQALAAQKVSYRQLHRARHGAGAVFDTRAEPRKAVQSAPLPSLAGPSPFSAPTDPLVQARNSLLNRTQAGPPTLALGSAAPTGTFGSLGTGGAFGAAPAPAFGAANTTFGAGTSGFGGANTTFGAGASTSGLFGGSAFGNTSFGASSPATGSKRNKQ